MAPIFGSVIGSCGGAGRHNDLAADQKSGMRTMDQRSDERRNNDDERWNDGATGVLARPRARSCSSPPY
jgi:hypothetical protein